MSEWLHFFPRLSVLLKMQMLIVFLSLFLVFRSSYQSDDFKDDDDQHSVEVHLGDGSPVVSSTRWASLGMPWSELKWSQARQKVTRRLCEKLHKPPASLISLPSTFTDNVSVSSWELGMFRALRLRCRRRLYVNSLRERVLCNHTLLKSFWL